MTYDSTGSTRLSAPRRPGELPAAAVDVSESVAAAVTAVPGVAALHGGAFGQIASYLPGRSVTGVRIRDDVTDVHVVLYWGAPVLATADRVRAAVLTLVDGLSARVDVTVEDVIDPATEDADVEDPSPGGPGSAAGFDPGLPNPGIRSEDFDPENFDPLPAASMDPGLTGLPPTAPE